MKIEPAMSAEEIHFTMQVMVELHGSRSPQSNKSHNAMLNRKCTFVCVYQEYMYITADENEDYPVL